jgi:hypothetical protein
MGVLLADAGGWRAGDLAKGARRSANLSSHLEIIRGEMAQVKIVLRLQETLHE